MKDLVSVIIPVYNVRKYLRSCIDSVRKQTYAELQIILVDDGSSDGSERICDEAAEEDERIIVIHRSNGGLSSARNTGIDVAEGRFICFLDSDDWLDERYIEKLYGLAIDRDADISVCSYIRVPSGETAEKDNLKVIAEEIHEYDNVRAVREVIEQKSVESVVWNKLYKRNLWDEIRFPEGVLHEDEFVTYKLLWKAAGIAETNSVLYYYRQRKDSITETVNEAVKRKRAFDVVSAKKECYEFFENREQTLYSTAFAHYMDCLKYVIRSGLVSNHEDKKIIVKKYSEGADRIWKVPGLSLYKRMALFVWTILIRLL